MTPSYNKSENSTSDLFSSLSNIESYGNVDVIQECGNGFLVIGKFDKIGSENADGVSYWNGFLF